MISRLLPTPGSFLPSLSRCWRESGSATEGVYRFPFPIFSALPHTCAASPQPKGSGRASEKVRALQEATCHRQGDSRRRCPTGLPWQLRAASRRCPPSTSSSQPGQPPQLRGQRAGGGAPSDRRRSALRDFPRVSSTQEEAADAFLGHLRRSALQTLSFPPEPRTSPSLCPYPGIGEAGVPPAERLAEAPKPGGAPPHTLIPKPARGWARRGARTPVRWHPGASARAPSSNARVPAPAFLLHPLLFFKSSSVNTFHLSSKSRTRTKTHPPPPSCVGPGSRRGHAAYLRPLRSSGQRGLPVRHWGKWSPTWGRGPPPGRCCQTAGAQNH